MDKLTAIKIKYDDGTYSDEIPVSVLSENVEWDSTHTLVDVLGSIDVDVTGTIQDQISQLFNEKVSNSDMKNYISSSMPTYITNWLNTNVNPVGSAVIVDSSLTITGAAADAKKVGDELTDLKSDLEDLNGKMGEIKPNYLSLVSGAIRQSDGYEYADNSRVKTPNSIYFVDGDAFSVDSTLQYVCIRYESDGTFIENITPNGFTSTKLTIATTGYYKFCLRLTNDTTADISGQIAQIEAKTYIEYV